MSNVSLMYITQFRLQSDDIFNELFVMSFLLSFPKANVGFKGLLCVLLFDFVTCQLWTFSSRKPYRNNVIVNFLD